MTPPTATARTKDGPLPSREAVLLEALATTGEALTEAIVHRDLDAIVAATRDAETLIARLERLDTERLERLDAHRPERTERAERPGRPAVPDPNVLLLGAWIGATARRNALLLERAWATDAALLRLLATAARAEAEAAMGTGYAQPVPDAQPSGWLDRSA